MTEYTVHPSLCNFVPVPAHDGPMNRQERQALFAGDLGALRDIVQMAHRLPSEPYHSTNEIRTGAIVHE